MKDTIIKERLREALQNKNMRQADLVAQTGIDKSQISSYLSGKYKPKQENLTLLAEALGVSEYWLLGIDETEERGAEKESTEKRLQAYAKRIYSERELEKLVLLYEELSEENRKKAQVYMARLRKVQEMEE